MTQVEGGRVVLVHGLWMNAVAMLPMAWHLERGGFKVTRYGYQSVRRGLAENARRLAAVCERAGAPLHLVGHSLGGLVIMAMMRAYPHIEVRRVVLIGSPYADSAAARGLARYAWSRGLLGQTIKDWLSGPRPPVPQDVQVGVIAGDTSIGLGRVFVSLPAPNDGVVILDETLVPGAADSIVVHISHSAMLVSPSIARAVCAFLRSGSFSR